MLKSWQISHKNAIFYLFLKNRELWQYPPLPLSPPQPHAWYQRAGVRSDPPRVCAPHILRLFLVQVPHWCYLLAYGTFKVGNSAVAILWMKKPRPREGCALGRGHTASVWRCWDQDSGLSGSRDMEED